MENMYKYNREIGLFWFVLAKKERFDCVFHIDTLIGGYNKVIITFIVI